MIRVMIPPPYILAQLLNICMLIVLLMCLLDVVLANCPDYNEILLV